MTEINPERFVAECLFGAKVTQRLFAFVAKRS